MKHAATSDSALQISHLKRRFGNLQALNDVSFSVPAGKVTGFLGPNGSGKTTLMRAIFGLISLDEGVVRWNGHEITNKELRRFGYLPEERGLYPAMPIIEQLVFFGRLHGLTAAVARKRALLWLDRLGLGDRATEKLQALSLGNQQRVQLAAMLLHEPSLLVLDEPFSGLDPVAVDVLAEILKDQARRGAAVLFSSHQLDLVQDVCERVVIIDHGCIKVESDLDAFRSSGPLHLVVQIKGDKNADWAEGIAPIYRRQHGRVVFELENNSQSRAIMQHALKVGDIEEFSFIKRPLSELFLEVLS